MMSDHSLCGGIWYREKRKCPATGGQTGNKRVKPESKASEEGWHGWRGRRRGDVE